MAGAREDVGGNAAWQANFKKMFEDAQSMVAQLNAQSVESANRSRVEADQLHGVALQAIQNAVETANMVGKQALTASAVATDRTWNVDEIAQALVGNQVFSDAVLATVAAAARD